MSIDEILVALRENPGDQPYLSPKRREFAPHVVYFFMFSEYHRVAVSEIQNTPTNDGIAICEWLLKMGLLEHPTMPYSDEIDINRYMYIRENAAQRNPSI